MGTNILAYVVNELSLVQVATTIQLCMTTGIVVYWLVNRHTKKLIEMLRGYTPMRVISWRSCPEYSSDTTDSHLLTVEEGLTFILFKLYHGIDNPIVLELNKNTCTELLSGLKSKHTYRKTFKLPEGPVRIMFQSNYLSVTDETPGIVLTIQRCPKINIKKVAFTISTGEEHMGYYRLQAMLRRALGRASLLKIGL